ncbi:VP11 [Micromonas pusilla reovirus]|uniref:Uncharacterized protein VP11 n=1 Tax=Micromonas pusilla reovirus (isolate Netherlands/2005) TaxID=649596 RepID=VP11_MPRVN|nr:VP11 [Micromonas pusilla reovirus]Q1I0U1.1 RecName: Full=Uncharacterized protein VP11 [Micromonas pusilla reovirus (isolate Netherlands)]AAZ94051.1 VP11 [Micromonas pusilla reovirus]
MALPAIHNWEPYEDSLIRIKHSCFAMHELYRERYLLARTRMMYYDVPIIVLSSVSSVFIAGGDAYMSKSMVQILTCIMSLCVGIIGSLKKFFRVDENREQCLETYKDLFRMFCELAIVMDMPSTSRPGDPQQYSTETSSKYAEIMQRSLVLEGQRTKYNPIYDDHNPLPPEKKKSILSRTRSTKLSSGEITPV